MSLVKASRMQQRRERAGRGRPAWLGWAWPWAIETCQFIHPLPSPEPGGLPPVGRARHVRPAQHEVPPPPCSGPPAGPCPATAGIASPTCLAAPAPAAPRRTRVHARGRLPAARGKRRPSRSAAAARARPSSRARHCSQADGSSPPTAHGPRPARQASRRRQRRRRPSSPAMSLPEASE